MLHPSKVVNSALVFLPDSSLTVKDVVKEFQPGGRMAQHKHGEVRPNRQCAQISPCWWSDSVPVELFIPVHSVSTQPVSVFFSKPTWERRTSPQISATGCIDTSSTQSRSPQREVRQLNLPRCSQLQKVTPSPPPRLSGGVFLRDVSCYFSVLEDGRPRDKLECGFLLLPACGLTPFHKCFSAEI